MQERSSHEDGLIAQCVECIFTAMKSHATGSNKRSFSLRASYYEVYNEQVLYWCTYGTPLNKCHAVKLPLGNLYLLKHSFSRLILVLVSMEYGYAGMLYNIYSYIITYLCETWMRGGNPGK